MNNQTHFPLPMIGLKLFLSKIPVGIIILSHVLKPDKLEGVFLRRNLGNFSYIMNEHCLNPEIFMNIK